jgi:hypothetical protein
MPIVKKKKELPASRAPEASAVSVIPYAKNAAFVWCTIPAGTAIAGLGVGGHAASIVERRKLLRSGSNIEVLLVEAEGLRDGIECELILADRSDRHELVRLPAQLARWSDADTPSVLKLIATRFAVEGGYPHVLERYLSFASTWQAPARVLEVLPEGALVELEEVDLSRGAQAYAVTDQGLKTITLQPVGQGAGQCVVWLPEPSLQHLYLDRQDALVRVALADGKPSARFGERLPRDRSLPLVDALHEAVTGPSPELGAWIAAQCPFHAAIRTDAASLDVAGVIGLSADTAGIFMTLTDGEHGTTPLTVEAFGTRDPLPLNIAVRESDLDGGTSQRQIIATTPRSGSACYRLTWMSEGKRHTIWLRETALEAPRNVALARQFMPVSWVRPDVFSRVLYPLATAQGNEAAPGLVQVSDFGVPSNAVQADVYVFVGADLEAAHRTVLALALTTHGVAVQVHLCLFDPTRFDELATAAEEWSKAYALPVRLTSYSARTTEAQVARAAFNGERPRILCRAGWVPRASSWVPRILQQLAAAEFLVLAGVGEQNLQIQDLSQLMPLAGQDQERLIIGGAIAAHQEPSLAGLPCLYTLEGFLLAQASRNLHVEPYLPLAAERNFAYIGSQDSSDNFHIRLDCHSLGNLTQPSSDAQPSGIPVRRRKAC